MIMFTPPITFAGLRAALRRSKLVRWVYYDLHFADIPVLLHSSRFEKEIVSTMRQFLSHEDLQNSVLVKSLRCDIRRCFCKYKATPQEYFLFGFQGKTEEERKTYLPDSIIMKSVANKTGRKIHDVELNDKYRFYQINESFFKRKAMKFDASTTIDRFAEFALSAERIIAKPNQAALGHGVEIFAIKEQRDAEFVFQHLRKSHIAYIIEEVIRQKADMAVWNPSSVNTIRINSFLSHGQFHILSPFMRTGRQGSIVDNGGQGGIFASIDENTGTICTDGMDESNNSYLEHPESEIAYKGWQVPQWKELIQLTEKIHRNMSKHIYVSWDFALTDNGWVLIEGNWGEFVCQQMTKKRGYKKEFLTLLNN